MRLSCFCTAVVVCGRCTQETVFVNEYNIIYTGVAVFAAVVDEAVDVLFPS